jgi:hypothetical protein
VTVLCRFPRVYIKGCGACHTFYHAMDAMNAGRHKVDVIARSPTSDVCLSSCNVPMMMIFEQSFIIPWCLHTRPHMTACS